MAEHVHKTVHVDAMLDEMTPAEFEGWCAKDEVEPIGHSTRMLGVIAYLIANHMAAEGEEVDPYKFVPWEKYLREPPKHNNAAARQMVAAIPKSKGRKRGN